jgi:trk system potassium uptake protein TrkH
MNLRPPLRFLGRLTLLVAAAQLAPLVTGLIYREWATSVAFAVSIGITAAIGAVLGFGIKGEGELYRREGLLIVVGGWVLASIFGALPYLFSGTVTSPVDALFEAASGFTTTGATVLLDIEATDKAILFWRSFTQWLGGMGIIVLFVALLPEVGPGARFLYRMEVPGPKAEALQPRVKSTAAILWRLYLGFTAAETILLMLAGMNLYDALTHTFSTLSTGGFSPRGASVAAFDSTYVHVIIIAFMVIAGTNFSLFFGLRARRSFAFFKDAEFRVYMTILAGATLTAVISLLLSGTYDDPLLAVRDSAFQVTSILTTTGFATADFELWPVFVQALLVGLMFVGGCAGSTAGSMKVMRMFIGIKTAFREVRRLFSPSTVLTVFVGGKPVPNSVASTVAGFFILYLSTWGIGAILLSIGSNDLVTAVTASAATVGNIGPGLGEVGPTDHFAFFGAWHKGIMVLLMLMGRLEIYSFAALVTRAYWNA